MAKQTYTTGQVLTAAQMTALQANDYNWTVSAKTASYVLVAADAGTRITMSNAGATTITVNTALFTAGDTLTITNIGAGACTITAGTATVSTAGSLVLNQYDSGTLYFSSTSAAIWNGANPGDITGVTAGTGISGGGTSGTVTVTNDMATTITTAGDLIYGTGSGTYTRRGIGSTNQVLTVSGGVPTWATPATTSSGLTLISTINQSNVASVTMDDIFTATYTKYVLVIDRWFALTAADDLLIKYRTGGSSGADASANHYSGNTNNQFQGTTWTNINATASANLILQTQSDTTVGVESTINFNNIGPTAGSTQAWCYGIGANGSNGNWFTFMGYNAAGATYTGLKFSSSSSNIYIKASVYGLAS